MAGDKHPIGHAFAVSTDYPISYFVERGVENAALENLIDVEIPRPERLTNARPRKPEHIGYFSNVENALLNFVDFGYTGYEIRHTTCPSDQNRMVVGTLTSYRGARRTSSTSHQSEDALAAMNDQFKANLARVLQGATGEVDSFVLKGIGHVLLRLEDVEGPISTTFPKLRPLLEELKAKYIAKADKEREKQVMEEFQAGDGATTQHADEKAHEEGGPVGFGAEHDQQEEQSPGHGAENGGAGGAGAKQGPEKETVTGDDGDEDRGDEKGGTAGERQGQAGSEHCEKCKEGNRDHYHAGDPKPRRGVALEEWYMMH
ncbi:hypothetical protein LTR85_011277 [Meristemomyces frigidus]|nr:hypothetical protein LTR85_011277 [Meristemomyces frigidus]